MLTLILILLTGCTHESITFAVKQDCVQASKIDVQLGLAYLEKNSMASAKEKFLQALAKAPQEPMSWYGMAYFLERTHDIRAAQVHYLHAIRLNDKLGAAHNNYGAFLCRQGRYQESIEQFELAVADGVYLDPAGAYTNAGICARHIPDENVAQQFFMMALEKDPDSRVAKSQLADLNKKRHKT